MRKDYRRSAVDHGAWRISGTGFLGPSLANLRQAALQVREQVSVGRSDVNGLLRASLTCEPALQLSRRGGDVPTDDTRHGHAFTGPAFFSPCPLAGNEGATRTVQR